MILTLPSIIRIAQQRTYSIKMNTNNKKENTKKNIGECTTRETTENEEKYILDAQPN